MTTHVVEARTDPIRLPESHVSTHRRPINGCRELNMLKQRRFASFLMGLTDMRRVAIFLLGQYAAQASPADVDTYIAAYQDYVLAVYQSYFSRYAGQNLRVRASRERAPNDYIVNTDMVGGSQPMQIDFRVRTDGAKPVLVDFAVAGVWLALAERDQFLSVLSQNKGDIKALTAHLRAALQH